MLLLAGVTSLKGDGCEGRDTGYHLTVVVSYRVVTDVKVMV